MLSNGYHTFSENVHIIVLKLFVQTHWMCFLNHGLQYNLKFKMD